MKPVVGVTPLYDDKLNSIWMLPEYLEYVEACGGLPIVLPLEKDDADIPQLLLMCDSILLTGGQDISPKLYGEAAISQCGQPNLWRDAMELEIIAQCTECDKPMFGICRGLQLLNVALGGDLYQDITSQYDSDIAHSMPSPYDREQHEVILDAKQPLQKMLGTETLEVNSYHHQAIKTLAPELRAMAHSKDGIVEAAYMPKMRFVWGVQWHPEYLFKKDKRQIKMLKRFIEASNC